MVACESVYMYIYYIQSLKCIWIKRFRLNENSAWTVIPNEATSHLGGFSFLSKCYCSSKDISIKKLPLFYIRTLQYWFEFKDMQDNTKPGIKNTIICDPPQDFNAKGESTCTTRFHFKTKEFILRRFSTLPILPH